VGLGRRCAFGFRVAAVEALNCEGAGWGPQLKRGSLGGISLGGTVHVANVDIRLAGEADAESVARLVLELFGELAPPGHSGYDATGSTFGGATKPLTCESRPATRSTRSRS
jgi:hypothetical protein